MGGNAWAITIILRRSRLWGAGFTLLKKKYLGGVLGESWDSGEQAWQKIGLPFDGLATQYLWRAKAGRFGFQWLP